MLNALIGNPAASRAAELANARFDLQFLAHGLPIRVPQGTRERIAALETLFECVWATSWEESARTDLAPHLGFGADWPVINFKDDFPDSGTWKLPAVERFADLPEHRARHLAWIDDDAEPDTLEWAARRSRAGAQTIVLRPDADVGMTSRHLDRLLRFHEDCRTRDRMRAAQA